MRKHTNSTNALTRNQLLVMNALSDAKGALSAYTLLDQLRDCGFRAPLQVYRALDKLVKIGLVHRLESMNAFIACQNPSCEGKKRETILFTICENCECVQELVDDNLSKATNVLAGQIDFSLENSVIELRGLCRKCKDR